jgi:hypothetical protein
MSKTKKQLQEEIKQNNEDMFNMDRDIQLQDIHIKQLKDEIKDLKEQVLDWQKACEFEGMNGFNLRKEVFRLKNIIRRRELTIQILISGWIVVFFYIILFVIL